jgi:SAM-dependent methyltransferase
MNSAALKTGDGSNISIGVGATWEFEALAACPLCAATQFRTIVDRRVRSVPLRFVRCTACGLVAQNPRLTREALSAYFSSAVFVRDSDSPDYLLNQPLGYHDYDDWDSSYKSTATLRLKRICRYKRPPGLLLEIGTATGSFLDVARRIGFSVRGLDLSTRFAEIASARYGLDIESDFIEEVQLPEARYDVVCAFGGIACWRDPVRGLCNIRQSLAPGGVFALNFSDVEGPLGRLFGEAYPEYNHASLTVFSSRTMHRCLRAAGLRIVFSQQERQYASIGRIVTYLKSSIGRSVAERLHITNLTIPVIAFGTVFAICVPDGEPAIPRR